MACTENIKRGRGTQNAAAADEPGVGKDLAPETVLEMKPVNEDYGGTSVLHECKAGVASPTCEPPKNVRIPVPPPAPPRPPTCSRWSGISAPRAPPVSHRNELQVQAAATC
jgi:hypothetical protein